jgi:hypothetical protein
MATAKRARSSIAGIALKLVLIVALAAALLAFFFGEALAGFGAAGTGYAAKTVCSCRHIAGRSKDSCETDLMPNMWAIWLTEDADAQSVTATVPLIASTTATYREGPGCVLERWSDQD